MPEHRWSGWPGAWCLDCGCSDPTEEALANGDYTEIDDPSTPMGFRFEFNFSPKLLECPEPNSRRHDPYFRNLDDKQGTAVEVTENFDNKHH